MKSFNTDTMRSAMVAAGMNQRELAEAVGMFPADLSRIMTGRTRTPQSKTVAKFADALGVPIESLYIDDDAPADPPPAKPDPNSHAEMLLLELFRTLDPLGQSHVMADVERRVNAEANVPDAVQAARNKAAVEFDTAVRRSQAKFEALLDRSRAEVLAESRPDRHQKGA